MANITVDSIVKLPKLQKAGILCGVVVLIIGLYWFLLYRGHSEKLRVQQEVLTKKQQELNEEVVILGDLPKYRKESEEMKNKRQKALEQLPNEKDIDKTGLLALLIGTMLYPEVNQSLNDLGTTWLGLAVASGYAYFGIKPEG